MKYIATSTLRYNLPPGIFETSDINLMLKSFFPNEVKVDFTIDDIWLRSNLTTNKTIRFTERSFFYTILGFTQSHSGSWGDNPGLVQLIPGSYKIDEPIYFTEIDKVQLKCDCINGSKLKGSRETILYPFALSSPRDLKLNNQRRIKPFKKINKSVLSHISFFLLKMMIINQLILMEKRYHSLVNLLK